MRCNPWRWLWGVIPIAILAFLTTQWEHERIEADLRQRAETALVAADLRWAVTAFDGRDALITGQAITDEAPQRALKVVQEVWGVRVSEARAHLMPNIDPYIWAAALKEKRVRLRGYVPSNEERSAILGVAKASFPDLEIDDKLELARGAPDNNVWLGGIGFALKQLGALKTGSVNIRGTGLSIEGEADGFPAYKTVKGALHSQLPPGITLVADRVLPPVVSPFTWTAKRSGNQLLLSGHVPDETLREQVFALAKKLFPRLAIVERLEPAQGAPQGLAAVARSALEQLAQLNSGQVVVEDSRIRFSGDAPDDATAMSVIKAFRAAAKGFMVSEDIRFPKPKPATISPYVLNLEVDGNAVVLNGYVPSEDARVELIGAVRKRFEGYKVTDRLALGSGEPAQWRACMTAGIDAVARLDKGSLAMSDTALTITGNTRDEALAEKLPGEVRAAANRACTPDVRVMYDAPPEPNLTWHASYDGEKQVVLSGEVIDARTRAALVQAATQLFPNAQITDRMTIAAAASAKWPVAAELALKAIAQLRRGGADLTGQSLLVSGEAKDTAVLTGIRDLLARATPKGYASREAIEVRSDAMIWAEREAKRKAEEDTARAAKEKEDAARAAKEKSEAEAKRRDDAAAAAAAAKEKAEAEAARKAAEEDAKRAAEKAEQEAAKQRAEEQARAEAERAKAAAEAEKKAVIEKRRAEADACQQALREVATSGTILFDWASANLDRRSRPTLDRLAEVAMACPDAMIEIEGHTDAEGTPERNLKLSERRAQSVVAYLTEAGVNASHLKAVGYGATRPVAPNDTAANRAKNRRIEFTVHAE